MRAVTILLVAAVLAACNTVQGIGRDVQGAGEAIEEGARSLKRAVTD